MNESFLILNLLIPGSQFPKKDIDVLLKPLINELKDLWSIVVWIHNVFDGNIFKICAALIWIVNDFLFSSMLSRWNEQGYKMCPTYNKDIPSKCVRGKVIYVGHRWFLASNSTLIKNTIFDSKIEKRPPPCRFSDEDILRHLSHVINDLLGKHEKYQSIKRKHGLEEAN